MPTRTDNTFQEALTKLLHSVTDLKTLPDADLDWVANLELEVLAKLRSPIDAVQQQGLTNANAGPSVAFNGAPSPGMQIGPGAPGIPGGGMPPPPGMPGGMPGGMPPHIPAGTGAGINGVASLPNMPNPDELRRLLSR